VIHWLWGVWARWSRHHTCQRSVAASRRRHVTPLDAAQPPRASIRVCAAACTWPHRRARRAEGALPPPGKPGALHSALCSRAPWQPCCAPTRLKRLRWTGCLRPARRQRSRTRSQQMGAKGCGTQRCEPCAAPTGAHSKRHARTCSRRWRGGVRWMSTRCAHAALTACSQRVILRRRATGALRAAGAAAGASNASPCRGHSF